jgi:glycosyltransferase involved in cell wall biosynthesis
MTKQISVIIPTYKEPDVLNVCLRSVVEGQDNPQEIIVVVDGFYELNRSVLESFKNHIQVLDLEENVGLCRATNLGVFNAKNEAVLIVNDDNVFPRGWDTILLKEYGDKKAVSVNQIEPIPSMFRQFYIKNLGREPLTFDLNNFYKEEQLISDTYSKQCGFADNTGSTLPLLLNKYDYIMVGGMDENYPCTGVVADWDLFMKLSMAGISMTRTYRKHFYHFVSVGTAGTPEDALRRQEQEIQGHQYARYKWRSSILHDSYTNRKYLERIV